MLIRRFDNEGAWIEAALDALRDAIEDARARAPEKGRARLALCLAGGNTPEPVYRAMAALDIGNLSAELWLGDERLVWAGDPARNGLMVERAFSRCAWRPAPRIRQWPFERPGERPDAEIAASYAAELVESLGPALRFDLAILGLGADGHTASLFPGRPAPTGLAAPATSPLPPRDRLTLTFEALSAARKRIFLVRGGDKAEAIGRLEAEEPSIPASALAGRGSEVLYLAERIRG